MKTFGDLFLRLIMVSIGVGLALVASGVFLSIGLFGGMFEAFFLDLNLMVDGELQDPFPLVAIAVIITGLFSSFKIVGLALLPLTLAIAMAELMKWRSVTSNLLLGGGVALFAGVTSYSAEHPGIPSDGTLIVLLATGFVGGFFYWFVAGRRAGKWLESAEKKPEDVLDRV